MTFSTDLEQPKGTHALLSLLAPKKDLAFYHRLAPSVNQFFDWDGAHGPRTCTHFHGITHEKEADFYGEEKLGKEKKMNWRRLIFLRFLPLIDPVFPRSAKGRILATEFHLSNFVIRHDKGI